MTPRKPGMLKRLGLLIVGSLLAGAVTCDVQHPLPHTETVLGVAIAQ